MIAWPTPRRGTWFAPRNRACPRTACRACLSIAACCAAAAPSAPPSRACGAGSACLIDAACAYVSVQWASRRRSPRHQWHRVRRHRQQRPACSASTSARSRRPAWWASPSPTRRRRFPGAASRCSAPTRWRDLPRKTNSRSSSTSLTTVVLARSDGDAKAKIPEGWALDRGGKPTTDPKGRSSTAACFRSAARRARCWR